MSYPPIVVPPSGGSLEIGNQQLFAVPFPLSLGFPLRGDSWKLETLPALRLVQLGQQSVPPSGGSLEIGNRSFMEFHNVDLLMFPLRGDP